MWSPEHADTFKAMTQELKNIADIMTSAHPQSCTAEWGFAEHGRYCNLF